MAVEALRACLAEVRPLAASEIAHVLESCSGGALGLPGSVEVIVSRTLRRMVGVSMTAVESDGRWSQYTADDLLAPDSETEIRSLLAMRRARRLVAQSLEAPLEGTFLAGLRRTAVTEGLDRAETIEIAASILVAGVVTTTQTACQGWLAANRSDIPGANAPSSAIDQRVVAESLRFVSFGAGFVRTASDGTRHLAVLAAANRDPAVFVRPNDFDPVRNAGPHLAFGFGVHRCLGAAVARLILEELQSTFFPHLRIDPDSGTTWKVAPVLRTLTNASAEVS